MVSNFNELFLWHVVADSLDDDARVETVNRSTKRPQDRDEVAELVTCIAVVARVLVRVPLMPLYGGLKSGFTNL